MTDAARKAIGYLRDLRDELELAACVPGQVVNISRQAVDAMLDDIAVVGRLIRQMAERIRE